MTAQVPTALQQDITELLVAICETPAPTFAEGERGRLIARLWREAGLEPTTDHVGNVVADLPGGSGPRVLVAAHLDTVFSDETDVSVRKAGTRLLAPGIGDNSASLAVLTHYLHAPGKAAYPRLTVAATVGEEGLGDLYGMRQLMRDRAQDFDLVVALDGHLGTVVDAAVGSKRFELRFSAAGGHSWGDYPSASAVHALGDAIHALGGMNVPMTPRSSYNVGQVWGGTSINAIAEQAGFNLDLRSLDAEVLAGLEREARGRISRASKRNGATVEMKLVGDRPTARVPNAALVEAALGVLATLEVPVRRAASSTDANASMAAGLPSVAFGVYHGGDAHRLSEWLEPASLVTGYRALEMLMARLSCLGVDTPPLESASQI